MSKLTTIILAALAFFIGIGIGTRNAALLSPKESIIIGGAFGLTGFSSTWGEEDRNGSMLAVEEANGSGGINGRMVELVIEDTQSDNTRTLSAVSKLINIDKAHVIIGPTWLDSYGSAAPLADEKNILMISPSAGITAVKSEINYRNVFSTWYRSDIQVQKLPSYLAEKGVKSVIFIISNDSFWFDVLKNFKKTAVDAGIVIADEFLINPQDIDLRTPLTKAKQAQPDMVFFGFNTEQNLSAFLTQRSVLYPKAFLFTTESIEEFSEKPEFAALLRDVEFIAPKIRQTDFQERYKIRFGHEPLYSASNAYDAVTIVLEAMKNLKRQDTDTFYSYVRDTVFETVTFGEITFDDIGGVVGGEFLIKKITEQGVEIIDELD